MIKKKKVDSVKEDLFNNAASYLWSCCDRYFYPKLNIEEHGEFNIQTNLAFTDYKKGFDKVNRNKIIAILIEDNRFS
jgi:hypothetical protein